ncbi:MAG: MBL fold metallo-hydrolase, partial [Clostridia bacterium]|nr:MBL fold metallo-hydrolase [Clostridia bacterium]
NIDKSKLNIFFFNVGQADSSLILYEDKAILIDTGNDSDGEKIVEFLKAKEINKIDCVIGTHIHEEHIGGMADIVDNISVEKIYMPYNVTEDANFYKKVTNSINSKKIICRDSQ